MNTRVYLGIDGGQSSTTALIGDESGRVLGTGRSGPCNHVSGPAAIAKFRSVVGSCVAVAAQQAGFDPETVSFSGACFGFSGGPEDKEALVREMVRSAKYKVTHDAEIALIGALSGKPGIIVISGTGSMAFGRNAAGDTARAGGWGYIFGDEGGAFDLVRRAVRSALRFEEGWGPETLLRERLLQATGAPTSNFLLHLFYSPDWPRSRTAALAPLITEASESGDAEAAAVIRQSAAGLAEYVAGVHMHLFRTQTVPVSYAGGTFASRPLFQAFRQSVQECLNCPVVTPERTPAEGALFEALRLEEPTDIKLVL